MRKITSSNIVFKTLDSEMNSTLIETFDLSNIGVYKWDYKAQVCYVNKYMIDKFNVPIDGNTTVSDYLAEKLDDNSLITFFFTLNEIRSKQQQRKLDYPVKNGTSIVWYSVLLNYDDVEDVTYGVMKAIDKKTIIKSSLIKDDRLFENILTNLPLAIFFINEKNELVFSNSKHSSTMKKLHQIIEEYHDKQEVNYDDYNGIYSLEVYEKGSEKTIYKVKYSYLRMTKESYVERRLVDTNNVKGVLYTHQEVKSGYTEHTRLQKILRANELIMEIRDIVDHVDDLNEMFHYLLSKIHTVIPLANRSCILRLDEEEKLYLDTSYGFKDEYVDEFRLPFNQSYAYLHMQNDFSKSVIINDIQKKYSDLFPDLKDDDTGFRINSNVTTPLVVDDILYGIVSVDSDENNVFDDVDLTLLDYMKIQLERAIIKYRKYRTIKRDSMVDSLTGVSNRRHLMEVLPSYFEKAKIENKSFHFVVFDIDKLKQINDTYGHIAGDMVIKQFSFIIHSNIRESDFIARIGGDEFVGIFYNISKDILIQRIIEWDNFLKNHPIEYKDNQFNTRFSYGIAQAPDEGMFFSSLLELADKRMYILKRSKD